ncbi:MAG TPA: DUF92 domain-containing protein [Roseiflexaceae bacterium]|nr:DUF92 domain-containing protein [Roseiflexaceae bacterium]HMP41423.1 DUF92 domain-containing protein [Roseiflexaceae bacterium]
MEWWRIVAGLAFSSLIGGLAYRRGSLSASGWLGAIITGTLTFGFGGWAWGMTLIIFFVTSSALSRFRRAHKEHVTGETFEKSSRRDIWQTLANGGVGALLALAYGLGGEQHLVLVAFAGVMATVTADTWATEIGVLSARPPRMITTLQPAAAGTSGAVSYLGLLATISGALLIGVSVALLHAAEYGSFLPHLLIAALIGGIAGSLCDSLLGATLQAIYRGSHGETERRTSATGVQLPLVRGLAWMHNDMVNLLSSLAGGMIAVAAWLILL